MSVKSVGIISPGDMGSAIGRILRDSGFDVITCLEGRSELTRLRAKESGIRDIPSVDKLITETDLIISVLVPSKALELAELVAGSVGRIGCHLTYADMNAIAPQTVMKINNIMY